MNTDFTVADHGTVVLLTPESDEALSWIEDYLNKDRMTLGTAVVVEHRYIEDILAGIRSDGLYVD